MKTFEEYRFTIKHSDISFNNDIKMKPFLELKRDDYFYKISFDKHGNAEEISLCKITGFDGNYVNYKYFSTNEGRIRFTYFIKNSNFRKVDDYTYTFTMFYDFPYTFTTNENLVKNYSEQYHIEIRDDVKND